MILARWFLSMKDFFFTPLYLIAILFLLFVIRNLFIKDKKISVYFLPAAALKIFGAIFLGIIYEYIYNGGDTSAYWLYGTIIGDSFWENPLKWIKLLAADGSYDPETFSYASRIRWYSHAPTYFICKVSGFFAPFAFNTYSVMAIFFALISFTGSWLLFLTFYRLYPKLHKHFAIAIFLIPSFVFWSSGLMKEAIAIGSLGMLFYVLVKIIVTKRISFSSILLLPISFYTLFMTKKYILICFLPLIIIWGFSEINKSINSQVIRVLFYPFLLSMAIGTSIWAYFQITVNDEIYSLENVGQSTAITANYINYISNKEQGSSYYLGTLDGSLESMLRLAPAAIFTTFFRPFIWEVRNPMMLLSALEILFIVYLAFKTLLKTGLTRLLRTTIANPLILFCLLFSVMMAFVVGISSYNFGTLVRYKIPIIPFFISYLYIVQYHNKSKKEELPALL